MSRHAPARSSRPATPRAPWAPWTIGIVAVWAFLALIYLQLPATLLLRFLPASLPLPWSAGPAGLAASGTIWEGELAGLQVLGNPVEQVRWTLSPWRVLTGRLSGHLEARSGKSHLVTDVATDFAGNGELANLRGQWSLGALQPVGQTRWEGLLRSELAVVRLEQGRFVGGTGTLLLEGLTIGPRRQTLGDFELLWARDSRQGLLRDRSGPVELRAALLPHPDGRWELTGEATARPDASAGIRDALLMFGPPDATGRHAVRLEFGVSGSP